MLLERFNKLLKTADLWDLMRNVMKITLLFMWFPIFIIFLYDKNDSELCLMIWSVSVFIYSFTFMCVVIIFGELLMSLLMSLMLSCIVFFFISLFLMLVSELKDIEFTEKEIREHKLNKILGK